MLTSGDWSVCLNQKTLPIPSSWGSVSGGAIQASRESQFLHLPADPKFPTTCMLHRTAGSVVVQSAQVVNVLATMSSPRHVRTVS